MALGVVLVGSLLPAPETGGASIGLFGVGVDKVVHAASYAVVAGLAAASRDWRRRGLAVLGIVVAVAVFGAGVEVAQSFVPGRTMSGADAVANAVGAATGVVGWWLFDRNRR
ncbi:VanZ family protein [Salinigranum sp. GCM10025319]|uniref:VanZ family protein n=1 Tax=Salinigranum sp. GCM10025319 TaxID=3252687 RepID=UPI00360BB387